MPRDAKLFDSCAGSAVRGFVKLRGNVTPRWIANAHTSRKRLEPAINKCLRKPSSEKAGVGGSIPSLATIFPIT